MRRHLGLIFIFSALTLVASFLMPHVNVNYDLMRYLPKESEAKQGLEKHEEAFGQSGFARVMVEDISMGFALVIKSDLAQIDGVSHVRYIDDVINETTVQAFLYEASDLQKAVFITLINAHVRDEGMLYPEAVIAAASYLNQRQRAPIEAIAFSYVNGHRHLFEIMFEENDRSEKTHQAIYEIKTLLSEYTIALDGTAVISEYSQSMLVPEILRVTMIIVPLGLLALLFLTRAFFAPVLFIITSAVAIVLNLGTNALLKDISFITQSMVIAMQLAISMDYIIFLIHAYEKNIDADMPPHEAIIHAKKVSFAPITGSALTTAAGFLAITLMRFTIGFDIGIVFAKGIMMSWAAALFLLPALMHVSVRLMQKTRHRSFLPKTDKHIAFIVAKKKWFLAILLLIVVPAYIIQRQNDFYYGDTQIGTKSNISLRDDIELIKSYFPSSNRLLIIMPQGNRDHELEVVHILLSYDEVRSVESAVVVIERAPDGPEKDTLLSFFESPNYTRIFVALNIPEEGKASFSFINQLRQQLSDYELELTGVTPVTADIKAVMAVDFIIVNLIAIAAIAIIIGIIFKKVVLPFLLLLVILSAIWLTLSIPVFTNTYLMFLGYLICNLILLGATIDYAILVSKRAFSVDASYSPEIRVAKALSDAGPAVMTSAIILAISGFALSYVSSLQGISHIGFLLGIGGLISALFTLFLLPGALIIYMESKKKD